MTETRIALTADEAESLRVSQRRLSDAQRATELAAARARVAVGEAMETQIAILRALAEAYHFDPDLPSRLQADGTLVVGGGAS